LDSIQQLIRDSLRPLFKRRFFSSSIPGDTGFSESFPGTDQGIATWFHDWLTPAIVSVLHMLTEVGSGKSMEIVLFALVLLSCGSDGPISRDPDHCRAGWHAVERALLRRQ
jgi:hypothetical protein